MNYFLKQKLNCGKIIEPWMQISCFMMLNLHLTISFTAVRQRLFTMELMSLLFLP